MFTSNTQRQKLALDRFDASLGTLLDVDIWFESDWSLGSRVNSVDPRYNKTASARGRSASKQRIRLLDPNKEVAANNEVLWSSCNDKSSCSATTLTSGLFNDSFDLGTFTLADFIGSDALDFRVVRILESDLRRCGPFDFCSHENFNNAWSGTVHVNYTYSVPEPTTLALMGLGLVALGAGRLRRFKA
ncbi:MAG: choice-of-anchor E domain-containing protein [Candidatus Thiodiazotropha sp.]